MPKQKPLNWKYINKILKHIHEEPKRLWMPYEGLKTGADVGNPPPVFPVCNTVACFYGWSNILRVKRPSWSKRGVLNVSQEAENRILGFTDEETEEIYYVGASGLNDATDQRFALQAELADVIAKRIASGEKSAKRIRLDYLD